jgi:hypothetical protein
MNWLNIYTPILRAPEFIGSDPVSRATWFSLLAYCVEQENGGRIPNCRDWKDRQWQQTAGVTADEVTAAIPLVVFDGADAVLWAYPSEKEAEVRHLREIGKSRSAAKVAAAKANGNLGGRPTVNPTQTQQKPNGHNPTEPIEGKGREGEGKEKGKEKRVCFSPPSAEEVTAYASSIGYPMNGQAWCDSYAQKGWMVGKSKMKDWKAAVRNWKAQGWTPSVGAQQPRQPAHNSYEAQDQRRADELMKDEEAAQRIKAMFAPELAGFDNK